MTKHSHHPEKNGKLVKKNIGTMRLKRTKASRDVKGSGVFLVFLKFISILYRFLKIIVKSELKIKIKLKASFLFSSSRFQGKTSALIPPALRVKFDDGRELFPSQNVEQIFMAHRGVFAAIRRRRIARCWNAINVRIICQDHFCDFNHDSSLYLPTSVIGHF